MKASDFAELLDVPSIEVALEEVAVAMEQALRGSDELVVPAIRMLNGGGKRLRPLLTIASARAADPTTSIDPLDSAVRSGAASVELVHVGSLVHDDIIDDAESRRGVVTVNAREGSSQAVLVGDFLLARAGVEAATVSKEVAMSLALTISDLCDGQSLEGLKENDLDRSVDDAIASIAGKTGALMRASCDIAAYAVGANHLADPLARFGMNFGIAFQLVDDLLDLLSTDELMGKPVNNDVKCGVYSVPALKALELTEHPSELRDLMKAAGESDDAAAGFREVVLTSGAIDETVSMVHDYNLRAAEDLTSLPDSPTRDGLAQLPERYLNGILAEKTAHTQPA
ncbi:MAG: polyprenyl synthetase family protein [Ilumatobacteraceae bacterium]